MWIALFILVIVWTILYRTAACGDLRELEALRSTCPDRLHDAVLLCRVEGTVGAIGSLALMIGSPNAALAVDGEEGLAIALLLASGFLFWLSLRLCFWGWRTKLR